MWLGTGIKAFYTLFTRRSGIVSNFKLLRIHVLSVKILKVRNAVISSK